MESLLIVLALVGAGAAGVRSSWSPCGRSMLSTITPLAERARRSSFGATASWFMAGALLGGACLGAVLWAGASAVAAAAPSAMVVGAVALASAVVACASDSAARFTLPIHRRQVNELWLDRFRPWVYGAGFGWQIGSGFATYIVGATLYLSVMLAVLTGKPAVALAAGVIFGAVRGVAVLAGRRITSPTALVAFHRRFDALERPVRRAVVAWELATCSAVLGAVVAAGSSAFLGALSATLTLIVVIAGAWASAPRGPSGRRIGHFALGNELADHAPA